ncbi:hypothetical protein PPYR_00497 [Photinus pyralis]|uniref:Protein TsetseEP domain-containing protein n=1 Tax=Photinus pyralis TaxID=7054 RepID=A0A1Y1NFY8_PHOPY|nr:uncharacterized protein LOC116174758 [Photinus pyralis]KAB0803527.1 hypothetical protein PPYR_00497 [Photinus pyralis]
MLFAMFPFLLVLVLANNVFSQLNDDLSLKMIKLSTGLQQKCTKNADSSAMAEIIMSAQQTMACANQHYSNDINANGYCTNVGGTVIKCIEGLADASKKCLDADEKYFPDFVLNGQKRILDKFCKTDYQNSINKLAASKCKVPFAQLLNTEFVSTCVPKLKLIENLDKGVVSLQKSVICSDLQSINTCMVNIVKTNCEVDSKDLKVFSAVFEEYQVECKTNSATTKVTLSFTTLGFILLVLNSLK